MTSENPIAAPEAAATGAAAVSAADAAELLVETFDAEYPELANPWRRAYLIAKNAHDGQRDKSGKDYFVAHVLNVMRRAVLLAPEELRERAAIVALLHDTVEDTREHENPVTLEELAAEFGQEIADDVDAVSQRVFLNEPRASRWEPYAELIARACSRDVSIIVKLADNRNNFETLHEIPDAATRDRLTVKYTKAYARLWPAYVARFAQTTPVDELQTESPETGDRR